MSTRWDRTDHLHAWEIAESDAAPPDEVHEALRGALREIEHMRPSMKALREEMAVACVQDQPA